MRKHLSLSLLLIAGGLSGHQAAVADVLLIEAIKKEPANRVGALPRPVKGMTMSHVLGRFGKPTRRYAPVGTPGSRHQPPITRWTYPKFTVFFENRHVVNTVVHRGR